MEITLLALGIEMTENLPSQPARVPPELLDRILDFLDPRSSYEQPAVHGTRRELSRCALTCQSFASRCQRQLFRSVTSRSEQDVIQLTAFMNWSQRQWITLAVRRLVFVSIASPALHFLKRACS